LPKENRQSIEPASVTTKNRLHGLWRIKLDHFLPDFRQTLSPEKIQFIPVEILIDLVAASEKATLNPLS